MLKIVPKYVGDFPFLADVVLKFSVRRADGSFSLALVVGCSRSAAASVLLDFRARRRAVPSSSRVLFAPVPKKGISLGWLACRSCRVEIEHKARGGAAFFLMAPPLQRIIDRFA